MAILHLLEASSRAPDTCPLSSRRQTRGQCILRPNREALTMMTADLPRLWATTTSTQTTITAATTTATPTTTLALLPAMGRNMANLAWNGLGRLLGSGRPLPADTVESERFVAQRASVLCVVDTSIFLSFSGLTCILFHSSRFAAVAIKTLLAENVRIALA